MAEMMVGGDQELLATRITLFRGLADPSRLAILTVLRLGPRTAGQLASECRLPPSRASNHLGCLLECGLISVEPRGRFNVYRLAHPAIARLLDASDAIIDEVAPLIDACRTYGSPSRRSLRVAPTRDTPVTPTRDTAVAPAASS